MVGQESLSTNLNTYYVPNLGLGIFFIFKFKKLYLKIKNKRILYEKQ
jgi:hypothetical protein